MEQPDWCPLLSQEGGEVDQRGRNKRQPETRQNSSKEAHQRSRPQNVLDRIEAQNNMKQDVSTQVPKENQETGLREQVDKQKYAETPGKTTVYTNYQERPLGRKGRSGDSTILCYVGDS